MRRLALAALLLCLCRPALADGGFLSGIGDLPLMAGLAEDVESAMVFDSPEGRIAQFKAAGSPSPEQVLKFYADSLPELGWKALGAGRFGRETEQLRLIVKPGAKGGSEVRFELTPLPIKK